MRTSQIAFADFQRFGELAQLARAPALHAGGHRFDSDILHILVESTDSIKDILVKS
jgi:hypothetical protein